MLSRKTLTRIVAVGTLLGTLALGTFSPWGGGGIDGTNPNAQGSYTPSKGALSPWGGGGIDGVIPGAH